MDSRSTGTIVIAIGVLAVLVGLVIVAGGFGWFGRLPGDIRIERGGTRVYIPIVSMIVVSLGLTIFLSLARRLF